MEEGISNKNSKPLTKAQRAIVNAGTEIRLDRATAEDAAYLARQFVQATLPHSDPKADTWSRQNGNFTLGIQAGFNVKTGKSYGLPAGSSGADAYGNSRPFQTETGVARIVGIEFAERAPGLLIRHGIRSLAAGSVHPGHSPEFRVDEAALAYGIETLVAFAHGVGSGAVSGGQDQPHQAPGA